MSAFGRKMADIGPGSIEDFVKACRDMGNGSSLNSTISRPIGEYEWTSVSLSAKLLQIYLTTHPNSSFVVSPYMVQITMGMCFMGSESLTKSELSQKIFPACNHVGTYLSRLSKAVSKLRSLRTVTRLVSTHRAEFYDSYRKKIRYILDKDETGNCGMLNMDFEYGDQDGLAEALDTIMDKKLGGIEMTNGALTKAFFDIQTRLLVLQAFRYTTVWKSPFKAGSISVITDGLFRKSADQPGVPVDYMQQEGTFRYFEGDRWKVLRKATSVDKFVVYFMLPADRRDITPTEFDYPKYHEVTKTFQKCSLQQVKVILPKFRLDKPWHDSTETLKLVGLVDTFKQMRANFCHMARVYDLETGFGITKIIEKSSFELNEGIDEMSEETGSASSNDSTASVSQTSEVGCTKVFFANSPFLFFLVHEDASDMTVLMSGRYSGP